MPGGVPGRLRRLLGEGPGGAENPSSFLGGLGGGGGGGVGGGRGGGGGGGGGGSLCQVLLVHGLLTWGLSLRNPMVEIAKIDTVGLVTGKTEMAMVR